MTAKPETNFWKSLKTCLEDGDYVVSRIESYATPGFPDCVAFHKDLKHRRGQLVGPLRLTVQAVP